MIPPSCHPHLRPSRLRHRLRWLVLLLALVPAQAAFALVRAPAALAPTASSDPYRVEVVQTSYDLTQRLTRLPDREFGPARDARGSVIRVDATRRYQAITGFGAAMTDSSAWLLEDAASPATRAAVLSALFGPAPGGIDLNVIRVPIGASDFTRDGRPYTYDDVPAGQRDPRLEHFSIAHDRAYILPALRQARASNPQVSLLASPWSAPAWMKANGSLDNVGESGTLLKSAYRPWANYLARFLRDYAAAGVPIAGLTPQNEPGTPTRYPGMSVPAQEEASWIAQDLIPALRAAGERPAIYAGDLGWGPHSLPFDSAVASSPAGSALSGIAWHCYYGQPGVMAALHRARPALAEILDECSPGGPSPTPVAEIAIASLREWASEVLLWNLALDPSGGPVQPPDRGCPRCVGLATISEHSHLATLTRAYYQLGQASAFVDRGARRVASGHFVSYAFPRTPPNIASPGLDDVALRNPDGSLVLIAYDNGPAPVTFSVAWRGRAFTYTLPAQATVTFSWNRGTDRGRRSSA